MAARSDQETGAKSEIVQRYKAHTSAKKDWSDFDTSIQPKERWERLNLDDAIDFDNSLGFERHVALNGQIYYRDRQDNLYFVTPNGIRKISDPPVESFHLAEDIVLGGVEAVIGKKILGYAGAKLLEASPAIAKAGAEVLAGVKELGGAALAKLAVGFGGWVKGAKGLGNVPESTLFASVKSEAKLNSFLSAAEKFLGKDFSVTKPPKGSDLILRSQDGLRQVRFDITDPHGLDPHVNVETFEPRNAYPGDRRLVQVENLHVYAKPSLVEENLNGTGFTPPRRSWP